MMTVGHPQSNYISFPPVFLHGVVFYFHPGLTPFFYSKELLYALQLLIWDSTKLGNLCRKRFLGNLAKNSHTTKSQFCICDCVAAEGGSKFQKKSNLLLGQTKSILTSTVNPQNKDSVVTMLRVGRCGVPLPTWKKYFSLPQNAQLGSEVHQPSYSKGTRALSPGVKRPGQREFDNSPPSIAEVRNA